jgi:branched-subunit amino acid aminotransferase/4-amino-4-deoxychorismate lyase
VRVWINGSFVDDTNAKTSVFDAGFQHGVGLFETMCAKNGRVFRAQDHMERIAKSATALRLTEKLHIDPLVKALQLTLEENKQEEARMRITITGGDLNLLQQTGVSGGGDPTIVIQTQPPTQYPDGFFENGVMVSIASGRVNPFEISAGHKTLNYWSRLLHLQMAAMQQCGEALWLTPNASITGGCVSNIFIVQNGTLLTPVARGEEDESDEPSAVLPGITRKVVMEIAHELGVGTSKQQLSFDDILGADEVFLTNSSWGVLPVIGLRAAVQTQDGAGTQDQQIGTGAVGPLTKQLHLSYQDALQRETTV